MDMKVFGRTWTFSAEPFPAYRAEIWHGRNKHARALLPVRDLTPNARGVLDVGTFRVIKAREKGTILLVPGADTTDRGDIAVRFGLDEDLAAVAILLQLKLRYDQADDRTSCWWPDGILAMHGSTDVLEAWLSEDAWKNWADRVFHGASVWPAGITFLPGDHDPAAYEALACLLHILTMAEVAYAEGDEVLCDDILSGDLVDILDDVSYETLARRIQALAQQEVAV